MAQKTPKAMAVTGAVLTIRPGTERDRLCARLIPRLVWLI